MRLLTETLEFVYRRRELKLKENVATSHIRLVATVASRTGTSRRSIAHLPAPPVARFDATTGPSSLSDEQVRALEECKR